MKINHSIKDKHMTVMVKESDSFLYANYNLLFIANNTLIISKSFFIRFCGFPCKLSCELTCDVLWIDLRVAWHGDSRGRAKEMKWKTLIQEQPKRSSSISSLIPQVIDYIVALITCK